MPVRSLRGHDDVFFDGFERLVIQTQRPQASRRVIDDNDISVRDQAFDDFTGALVLEVQTQAPFVSGALGEYRSAVRPQGNDKSVLAAAGFFHPDDVGAQVTEKCGAIRTRNVARKVEDPDPAEYILVLHIDRTPLNLPPN